MKYIYSEKAPHPVGPYSHAVQTGNFLFLSGQIGIDPQTGDLVSTDIRDQTKTALNHIKAILEEAGCDIESVVKTTVFLTTMEHFTVMNEIYAEFFGSHRPARSCVAVSKLPKNALVEIEVIAYMG
ncbi:MAG: RidA family protein [Thermodesulforhabdaceae bacterium]